MEKVLLYVLDTRDFVNEDISIFPLLDSKDYESIEKIPNPEVRLEKAASIYLKKKYIGDYYLSSDNKPLSNDKYFNISHSKGVVVLALSPLEVGVDIEVIREYKDELARYISSEEEYGYITSEKNFFEIWTSKESLVKCLGTGIKQKVSEIPAFPLNGIKVFKEQTYKSSQLEIFGSVVSITLKGDNDFEVCLIEETLL